MKATTIGEKIRNYRYSKSWTQEEMAYEVGISVSELSRLERNISRPSMVTMDRIEKALGLPKGALRWDYRVTDDENGVLRSIETRLLNADLSLEELKKIALIVNMVVDLTVGWDEPIVEGITKAPTK